MAQLGKVVAGSNFRAGASMLWQKWLNSEKWWQARISAPGNRLLFQRGIRGNFVPVTIFPAVKSF
jgi:hypothetical protein